MSDLERLIKSSLEGAAEGYGPPDVYEARQRFLQRRRRRRLGFGAAGAVTVGAAVAIALVVVPQPTEPAPERRTQVAARPLEVVATIPVGGLPNSVAPDGGTGVWVTNVEGGGIARIDPSTNEVSARVDLGSAPTDEVVGDGEVVWASDRRGTVWKVDPAGEGRPSPARLAPPGDHHLDLALSDGTLWVTAPPGDTLYSVTGPKDVAEHRVEGAGLTDVAATASAVWTLDAEGGVRTWTVDGSSSELATVAVAAQSDLLAGFSSLWVSSGDGVVYKIDVETGEVENEAQVGDSYADLALGDDAVLVLAADVGGASQLVELDPFTGEPKDAEPLLIHGEPMDVSADAGAIWVPDQSGGRVLRIGD